MDQKKIYVITHGLRDGGFNPTHNLEGHRQITQIALRIVTETPRVPMIMSGVGERFLEIVDTLLNAGIEADEMKYSPLCGTHAGLDTGDGGTRVVVLGETMTIPFDDWYWAPPSVVDYWAFLNELPDGAVVCAGGELMISLGGQPHKGRLFEVDPEARTITDITNS